MREYISPIGYSSATVTRPILSRGIETGDHIVLVRPEAEMNDNRAREAITDVERLIKEIEPDVSLTVQNIPHDDMEAGIIACSDAIRTANGDPIVNLSGGPRDILLPLTIASLIHATEVEAVLRLSDLDGSVYDVDLPRVTTDIPQNMQSTLAAVAAADGPVTIQALTNELDQSKSTVSRHITRLAESSLVDTWKEGKVRVAQLSLSGQLLLRSNGRKGSL